MMLFLLKTEWNKNMIESSKSFELNRLPSIFRTPKSSQNEVPIKFCPLYSETRNYNDVVQSLLSKNSRESFKISNFESNLEIIL